MRILTCLILTLLIYRFGHSQEITPACEPFVKMELDSASGVYSKISREDITISKDGKAVLTVVLLVMERTVIINVTAIGGVYCIDETSKINIVFRDGTALEMANNGKFNCDGDFSLFFYGSFGNKKQFEHFVTKEIDRIKVGLRKSVVEKTRENFVEAAIPADKSKVILQTLVCLVE